MVSSNADAAPAGARPDTVREVVQSVADLVSLVEPRLLALWKSTGMTFAQRRVLRQLREGSLAAGMIAASLGTAAPTLTRQLARLEARGLLTRSLDPRDRRRVLVSLTAAGRRSLADHRVFKGDSLVAAARRLGPRERQGLISAVDQLVRLTRRPPGDETAHE